MSTTATSALLTVIALTLTMTTTASAKCLGAFQACPSTNTCVLFPQDCSLCSSPSPTPRYVCPDHKTCVPLSSFPSCPGIQNTIWDTSLSVSARVSAVINATSVQDWAGQLWNWAPGLYDVYVPPFNWLNDDEHGVKQNAATSFPNGGSLGSTWSPSILNAVGKAIGVEARGILNSNVDAGNRGIGQNGIGITAYAPNLNLVRDPRWGRAQEVYSEDPELSSSLVTALIEGIQSLGGDNKTLLALACAKHYAAYDLEDIPQVRFVFDAQVDAVNMWETYMAVFRHAIVDAQAGSVMASYNSLNGVPTACDADLLNGILRSRWGFEGFVVGDYDAVANIVNTHHYVQNYGQAAVLAWQAGMDQEGGGTAVIDTIPYAVQNGHLSKETVAASLARLLSSRVRLGLFDPPGQIPFNIIDDSSKYVQSPEHVKLARDAATAGTCMYKNAGNALPLDASSVKLAVIGPQALQGPLLQGNYAVPPLPGVVTLFEGINAYVTGEPEVRSCGTLLNNTDYYVPGGVGVVAGSPDVCCTMCSFNPECVLWTWYDSLCYLKANASISPVHSPGRISGKPVPSGSPRITFAPGCNAVGCEDESGFESAGRVAAGADAVLVVLGLNQTFERETHDRTTIDFPQGQYDLVSHLRASVGPNTPIIGVLIHGGTLAFHDMESDLDAILDMWYPGQEAGNALASILFGQVSPAGRVPVTYYEGDWDLPPPGQMDLLAGQGTTYRYFTGTPTFPFGFGLSYTTFSYSALTLPSGPIEPCAGFTVSFRVTNTGSVDSDEVSQVYLALPHASVPTARIRLAAFARNHIPAGQSLDVSLQVSSERLSVVYNGTAKSGSGFWDPELVVEAGDVQVWVGGGQPAFTKGVLEGGVSVGSTSKACVV